MRECQYEECGADLTGYPPASKYCSIAHAALAKREQEAAYARRNRPLINRRRRNREAKKARQGGVVPDPSPQDAYDGDDNVIDYTVADQAPKFLGIARGHPRHDSVTRARLARQAQDADVDMTDWSDLVAMQNSGRWVRFDTPPTETHGDAFTANGIGQSVPRSRGLYGRADEARELINPAAEGMAVVASPARGRAMVQEHTESRFGSVEMPPPIHSGQLAAPPTTMLNAEKAVVAEERTASDHLRAQAGYAAWRR